MSYVAATDRYERMRYQRCGASGLCLPLVSLGLWHNFGSVDVYENARRMAETAFDLGVTHFDLANNYGPVPGSAELTFGRILRESLASHRDELIISSKAGFLMWPGPYGEWGSRKNLIASCDQSLRRLGVDYVDVFYHHRPDPQTPIEESMGALEQIVKSGKALYAGISNYAPAAAQTAMACLRASRTPFVLHQMCYNMLNRTHEENGLFELLSAEQVGGIAFSPLAQGLLTDRYLEGIPDGSRATRNHFLKSERITAALRQELQALQALAQGRGQSLASMALAWVLRQKCIASVLVGASSPEQIRQLCRVQENLAFSADELEAIEAVLQRIRAL